MMQNTLYNTPQKIQFDPKWQMDGPRPAQWALTQHLPHTVTKNPEKYSQSSANNYFFIVYSTVYVW
jgi:hypothetical protein